MIQLTDEQREFREHLCRFLTAELTPETRAQNRDDQEFHGWTTEYRARFRRMLGEQGFIGMGWPALYGGGGKDMVFEVLYAEEMEYHGGPGLEPAVNYIPYALNALATDAQKHYFLPRLRKGEISFFLGYSEPEAGSDLANLSTSAVEEGDVFVITGQKMYSSYAHHADWGLVAARTDSSGSKHAGITLFLVDMQTPGIQIARHPTMAGWVHASVYFDHVRVPASGVVGGLNNGWRSVMTALDFERASLAAPGLVDRQIDRLVTFLHSSDPSSQRPVEDPGARDLLVTLSVEAEASRLYSYEVARRYARGDKLDHQTSLSVLLKRETARLGDSLGMQVLGAAGQLTKDSPLAIADGAIEHGHRDHIYFSFAAGGFDITRNVIAIRGLKLPRPTGG
jgi:3-oxocholest-4-en-26-oyl-CoA dehydrogenase alpha subunit